MDSFATICDVPVNNNICSCCLNTGCLKDICTEYLLSGHKEVYKDMLQDTFNVQMVNSTGKQNSRFICEQCIMKLKQGRAFKQMVLKNQDLFLEAVSNLLGDEKDTKQNADILHNDTVKTECIDMNNDFDIGCNDDSLDDFDDEEVLANIKLEISKERIKDFNVLGSEEKSKQKIPVKDDSQGEQQKKKDWSKIAERRGNGPILRENSLKIISNSTVCVFQWNKSRYRCFCCKEPFNDIDALREHSDNKHNLQNIEKIIISQQNRLVKVEISNLFCKICNKEFHDLNTLRTHLCDEHKIITSKEDLLVPFKIKDGALKCQICQEAFTVFRLLNIHMNKHFQKQVCHICGAGFSNLVFLNLHKTRLHRPLCCKECDLVFTTKSDKKSHDAKVHGVKQERKLRFPCPYCSERFFQENFRVIHLVEKHAMVRPEFRCGVCRKNFITRSLLNNHVRNVHMKEKNHKCDICHHLFYNKSDVARHKVTHTGEKKYNCMTCSNNFATKDSLKRHVKRTHVH